MLPPVRPGILGVLNEVRLEELRRLAGVPGRDDVIEHVQPRVLPDSTAGVEKLGGEAVLFLLLSAGVGRDHGEGERADRGLLRVGGEQVTAGLGHLLRPGARLDPPLGRTGGQVHHVRHALHDQGRHLGRRGLRVEQPLDSQGRLPG